MQLADSMDFRSVTALSLSTRLVRKNLDRIVPLDVRTQVVVAIFADAELRIQGRCREADYDFFATLIGQPCWTHLQTVT